MNTSRPLVPEDRFRQPAPRLPHIPRAAWAAVTAALLDGVGQRSSDPVAVARRLWPDDEISPLVLQRAAIDGARTTVSGWASQLVTAQMGQWIGSLIPASAAAALIARGTTLPVTDGIPVNVPIRSTAPAVAGWVDEAGAIAVRQWSFTTAALSPRKLGVIVTMTKELARYSGAEAIFRQMLAEEASLSLDAAYFSASAGSAAAHQGLLYGLVARTSSDNMVEDLAALAASVGAGGSGQVVFVMDPARAAAAAVRMPAQASATILASAACPAERVIAVDPVALVHGFGLAPEILASEEPVVHMESVPLQIATGAQGSGVLATPTQSAWQTSQIAFRMILDVSFAARRSGAVAFADGCSW